MAAIPTDPIPRPPKLRGDKDAWVAWRSECDRIHRENAENLRSSQFMLLVVMISFPIIAILGSAFFFLYARNLYLTEIL